MYILYIIQDVLCMSACSCMSVYTSACQFLCVCMDACACIYAHKQACMCMIVHVYQKHPGGPETALVKKKKVCLKYLIFALPNRHFCKPNCSKFSRENLAKFAFRDVSVLDSFHWGMLTGFFFFFLKKALQR